MVDATTNVGAAGNRATTGSSSLAQLSEDYNAFLTLLTAQISNQDPLSPMDSTQFVDQLATLSQVEQSIETNIQLEALAAKVTSFSAIAGTNMLGREVTVESGKVVLENGQNNTFYTLPDGAGSVKAEIVDPTGTVIRTLTGLPTTKGEQLDLPWDGMTDTGDKALEGVYTIRMTATDVAGEDLPVFTYRRATVQEMLLEQGDVFLDIGADEMAPYETILGIS